MYVVGVVEKSTSKGALGILAKYYCSKVPQTM
jgi:hypothetical protein